jgi:CBS domain-containing protein
MRVKDCMSKDPIYVTEENSITSVAKLMNEHHVGSIPVCDDNKKVLGIVTDRDIILRSIACDKDVKQTKVADIMSRDVIKTSEDTDASWVADIMSKNQIRRVPVVRNEELVGMVSIGDLARNDDFSNKEVADCMCDICTCTGKHGD